MNQQTENDNTKRYTGKLIANFLKDKFKDKKLEGLGITFFAVGKIIFRSAPSIKELCLVVLFVLIVRISKKIFKLITKCSFLEILEEWGRNIDVAWENFCKRQVFPVFEPHQFIQWLTAGKFNANIACKEKTHFFERKFKCKRKACHFTHRRIHMPKAIRMSRLAAMFVGNIYISEYLNTFKLKHLGSPGDLLEYSVFGIIFQLPEEHWSQVLAAYGVQKKHPSQTVVELAVHVARFTGRIRLSIEARKIRNEGGMAVIHGKYLNILTPARIRPHRKGCLSIPLCDIWQQQHDPRSKRTYTPVHPIP